MTPYQFEVWKRKSRREFVKRFKPSAASVISVCYDRVQIGTLELENQTVEVVYDSPPPLTPEYS